MELIDKIREAGPSREVDYLIHATLPDPKPSTAPRYSESIDAALTLVPEGHAALIGTMAFKGTSHKPYACLWQRNGFLLPTAEAATPALALCIAALLARAALAGAQP